MTCKCNDRTHESVGTTIWHRAYCTWYDHDRAGNSARAAFWGWLADRACRFARTA